VAGVRLHVRVHAVQVRGGCGCGAAARACAARAGAAAVRQRARVLRVRVLRWGSALGRCARVLRWGSAMGQHVRVLRAVRWGSARVCCVRVLPLWARVLHWKWYLCPRASQGWERGESRHASACTASRGGEHGCKLELHY